MVLLLLPLSKSGLNYLRRWFISLKFEDKKIPGLKTVSGLDKPDNGVIGGRKGSETWFKLRIEKTKVATLIWRQKFEQIVEKYFFR